MPQKQKYIVQGLLCLIVLLTPTITFFGTYDVLLAQDSSSSSTSTSSTSASTTTSGSESSEPSEEESSDPEYEETPSSSESSEPSEEESSDPEYEETPSSSESSEPSEEESSDPEYEETPVLFCGDALCTPSRGERCSNCATDCGLCVPYGIVCGDGRCDGNSDCFIDCPDSVIPKEALENLLQEIPLIPVDRNLIEQVPQETVEDALDRLSITIAKDPSLQNRLQNAEGTSLTAYLAGGDNLREMSSIIERISQALEQEAEEVRTVVLQDLFLSPSVSRLLSRLPQRGELMLEAQQGNLARVLALLPPPTEIKERRLQEIGEYDRLLREQLPELFAAEKGSLLFPRAIAEEVSIQPMDAKTGFMQSVFLRKRMEAMGIDPRTGLPSLEQDIQNLQARKNTLAGIIGIMEKDLEAPLNVAESDVENPSTTSLLNIRGLLAYIRSSANFEALEETYEGAVSGMRTGIGKIGSLFAFKEISPAAEAKDILGTDLAAALSNPDFEQKKSGMIKLLETQAYLIDELLAELPEEERTAFTDEFSRIKKEANLMRNSEDIDRVITEFLNELADLERAARMQHSFFAWPLYLLQDFFGISS